jgi:hypothetical protein
MANDPWFVLRGQLGGGAAEGVSPDIILGGPKPVPNYVKEYGTAFGQSSTFTGSNFIYVRARNTGTDLAIGSVAVFATQLGTLPQQGFWIPLHTSDGRASTNIAVAANGVATNGVPLIWEPAGPPPPSAPWCLIAEITGDAYPRVKVPSTVTDKASFDAWIATQSRLAYLVVKAQAVVPSPVPTFSWERAVHLDNAAETTLSTSLTCTKASPGGYLSYVFDQKDKAGQAIGVGKTLIQLNAAYSQSRTVPAGFNSKVTATYMPTVDGDMHAEFLFQVAVEVTDGDDGDLGNTVRTVVAEYVLSFGQTKNAT